MMKILKLMLNVGGGKKAVSIFSTVLFLSLIFSCADTVNETNEKDSEEDVTVEEGGDVDETSEYQVGASITLDDGFTYIVVDEPAGASVNNYRSSRAALSDAAVQLLVQAKSIQKTISFARTYLDSRSFLLIRSNGKITVPSASVEDEYAQTKAAIAATFPSDTDETVYYTVNHVEGNDKASYRDIYYVAKLSGLQFKKVGTIETIWTESASSFFTNGNGESVKLRELLKEYHPELIRKKMPDNFKIRKLEDGVTSGTLVFASDFYDSENLKSETTPSYYYKTENSISPALMLQTNYKDTAEKEFSQMTVWLLGEYGKETQSIGLRLIVKNKGNGSYSYKLQGETNNSGTESKETNFTFSEDGTYSGPFVDGSLMVFGEECTLYDGKPYNKDALWVPVDLVLESDGTISLGDKMEAWAERWWSFIIANNDDAYTLDGEKVIYTAPDYLDSAITAAELLKAETNDENGVSFTVNVPFENIKTVVLRRKDDNSDWNTAIDATYTTGQNTYSVDYVVTLQDTYITAGTTYSYELQYKTSSGVYASYALGKRTAAAGSGEMNTNAVTISYDSESKSLLSRDSSDSTAAVAPAITSDGITTKMQIRISYKCDSDKVEYKLMEKTSGVWKTEFALLDYKDKSDTKTAAFSGKTLTFNQFILEGLKEPASDENPVQFKYYQYYNNKNISQCNITLDDSAKTVVFPSAS